jgi:hypothetical protein
LYSMRGPFGCICEVPATENRGIFQNVWWNYTPSVKYVELSFSSWRLIYKKLFGCLIAQIKPPTGSSNVGLLFEDIINKWSHFVVQYYGNGFFFYFVHRLIIKL